MKVKMYVLSLFFLFIPITFYFSGFDDVWDIFFKSNVFCDSVSNRMSCITANMGNQLSLSVTRLFVCIFLVSLCGYTYWWYKKQLSFLDRGITSAEVIVVGCEKESTEYLSFLSTYIMPLVFTDLTKPSNVFNFIFILIIVGFLHIKTRRIHSNPTLSLFGVSAYKIDYLIRVDGQGSEIKKGLIVLSRDEISMKSVIRIIKHKDYITFAKYIRNDSNG